MCRISGRGRKHEFRVGGDFQVTHPVACIHDGYAADLGVILRRDDHFQDRGNRPVATDEFRAIVGEAHLVTVGLHAAWLIASGPQCAAFDVTQKEIAAGIIAGGIFTPACHPKIVPSTVARPGSREHHRIPTVGE